MVGGERIEERGRPVPATSRRRFSRLAPPLLQRNVGTRPGAKFPRIFEPRGQVLHPLQRTDVLLQLGLPLLASCHKSQVLEGCKGVTQLSQRSTHQAEPAERL